MTNLAEMLSALQAKCEVKAAECQQQFMRSHSGGGFEMMAQADAYKEFARLLTPHITLARESGRRCAELVERWRAESDPNYPDGVDECADQLEQALKGK